MKITHRLLLLVSCFIFGVGLLLIPISDAMAKGKGNHKAPGPPERPAGWDKGKKEGWDGDVPPGLEGKWKEEGASEKGKRRGPKDDSVAPGATESGGEKEGKVEKEEKGEKHEGKGKQKKVKD